MQYTIAARLSGLPEVWREIRPYGKPLRFDSEEDAQAYMVTNYPVTLQGTHVRSDVFHGIQPLRVLPIHYED